MSTLNILKLMYFFLGYCRKNTRNRKLERGRRTDKLT